MKSAADIGLLYSLMAGDILPTLTVHSQAVLNQLFLKFSKSDGDSFEYDSASLSANARLTTVTLRHAIKTLESLGLVEILQRGSSHKPTRYRLKLLDKLEPHGIVLKQSANGSAGAAENRKNYEYTPIKAFPGAQVVDHLSFPYNWANSNMSDDVLISGVLRKNRFQDVLSICVQYGLDKISAVAAGIKDPDIRTAAEQTLKRIRIGKEIASEELKN